MSGPTERIEKVLEGIEKRIQKIEAIVQSQNKIIQNSAPTSDLEKIEAIYLKSERQAEKKLLQLVLEKLKKGESELQAFQAASNEIFKAGNAGEILLKTRKKAETDRNLALATLPPGSEKEKNYQAHNKKYANTPAMVERLKYKLATPYSTKAILARLDQEEEKIEIQNAAKLFTKVTTTIITANNLATIAKKKKTLKHADSPKQNKTLSTINKQILQYQEKVKKGYLPDSRDAANYNKILLEKVNLLRRARLEVIDKQIQAYKKNNTLRSQDPHFSQLLSEHTKLLRKLKASAETNKNKPPTQMGIPPPVAMVLTTPTPRPRAVTQIGQPPPINVAVKTRSSSEPISNTIGALWKRAQQSLPPLKQLFNKEKIPEAENNPKLSAAQRDKAAPEIKTTLTPNPLAGISEISKNPRPK